LHGLAGLRKENKHKNEEKKKNTEGNGVSKGK